MPDSPPARRILTTAMTREPYDPSDTPAAHLERLGETVERDPVYQKRQERIRRRGTRRPLHPFYGGPAVGLTIVALGLLALWIAGLLGLV